MEKPKNVPVHVDPRRHLHQLYTVALALAGEESRGATTVIGRPATENRILP